MKAQMAIESLAAVGLVILFFIAAMVIVFNQDASTRSEALRSAKEMACNVLASEVASVSVLGVEGEANITVKFEFGMSVQGSARYADIGGYLCTLCCPVTNGTDSVFNISPGHVLFSGNSGSVVVRNA